MDSIFSRLTEQEILKLPKKERPGIAQYFIRDGVTTKLGQVEYVDINCITFDDDKLIEAINTIANTAILIPLKEKENIEAASEAYQSIMSKISEEKFPELIEVLKNAILVIDPHFEIKRLRSEHN
jgi:hypothetical protein